ncbi:MAG: GNAT family N-acetyltransferase [Frankiales bacterium]|nr:GNAT family N-acetyltransferase [Frankiales bacterium]
MGWTAHGTYPRAVPQNRVVVLAPVGDPILEQLVAAATSDAAAGEVTPPLTPGDGWTPERVAWLRRFHVDRRAGLKGEAHEVTWAVLVDGHVVGGARLAHVGLDKELEVGMWLTRQARGSGVGRLALALLLEQAAAGGFVSIRADTSPSNAAALTVLRNQGFTCSDSPDGRVHAQLALRGGTENTE